MADSTEEVVGMVVKLAAESTDFQNQMATLNRQMKVLQSDYKASASASTDFDKTMEGLATKSVYLNNAIKTQESILEAHSTRLEKSKQRLADLANAQIELKSKLDSTKSAYEQEVQLHGESSDAAKDLANQLKALQTEYDKNNDKINNTTKTIDNQTISYNNARATLNNFVSQLRETESSMQEMGNASDNVSESMNSLNGTGNPFSQFTDGVKGALGETQVFGVSLGEIGGALAGTVDPAALMTGAVAGITSALTEMVIQGIQQAISAIGQLMQQMVSTGNAFYAQISRLQALTQSTQSASKGFNDLARQLGSDTVYSASEAAQAMEYAALAGWKLEDMTEGMPAILNLAAASGEELATVSDILTDDITALGYTTSDATHIADVFATTMSNSNTNVEMLGEAMSYAGATAGALGYSVEDVSAAIGLMANSGVKGSSAGTALRKIMVQLASGVTLSSKAMGTFTVSAANQDGTIKPLNQTVGELREAFSQMTEEEKAANAEAIGGKTAMTGLLTIVNATESDYKKLTSAINNSSGACQNMANIMTNNVSGQLTLMGSKIESIGLSIYSVIEPILLSISKVGNLVFDVLDTVIGYVTTVISTITGYITPVVDIIVGILTTIKNAVTTILDPIFEALNQKSANTLTMLQNAATSFLNILNTVFTAIEPILVTIGNLVAVAVNVMCGNWSNAANNMKTIFNQFTGDTEKEAKTHEEAMAEISAEGSEETTNSVVEGLENRSEKFKTIYEEIESETDEHYDNLKLMADAYNNDLTANEEAYEKWKLQKLDEWEEKYEETHNTATLNGLKRMEQARAEEEAKLDEQIASDRSREEEKASNKLQIQKDAIDQSINQYQEGANKQDKITQQSTNTQKGLFEKLCDSISNMWEGIASSVSSMWDSLVEGLSSAANKISSFFSGSSSKSVSLKGYATGTNNHPGGLCIVGENGPELANISKGSTISSNNDTASLLRNANAGTESLLGALLNKVDSLERTIKDSQYSEAVLTNM